MARTKAAVPEAIELPVLDGEMLTANQNAMATMAASHSEERDWVNQLLGQVQMARSFARFADVVSLTKLKHVKESKLYRALAGKKALDPDGNEIADVGTWDGFCQALGLSRSKVDEDLTNLSAFGEEALKQLSAIGAGYREMRQYRRLPEDQKSALIEVAKTGDKDAFVDLAEEIIAKHAREKEELTQRLDETNADYEAQAEVMAKKTTELDKTKQELEKTRKRIQSMPANEAVSELRQELAAVAYEAEATILGALREGFTKLAEHSISGGEDQRLFKANLIRQLETVLAEVRSEFHLPAELDVNPAWLEQA
ncbi:hypothetical protein [Pseudomonas rubra]|uniref:Uncharacterized protein n=1 Tax=Pseudomonas rubra TaxID=2942627 RepID=A0ABT5P8L0_9PSED|nr:hypothetical protein [Pseudomonas rubra]MDD1014560.1 hypothetical protein [Pseudomonas rubra]MDD1041528.1 hypothetical protein [Pseudomonas rubra]MDD1157952.1 hypothetical protein [Pseudomonas rubra]